MNLHLTLLCSAGRSPLKAETYVQLLALELPEAQRSSRGLTAAHTNSSQPSHPSAGCMRQGYPSSSTGYPSSSRETGAGTDFPGPTPSLLHLCPSLQPTGGRGARGQEDESTRGPPARVLLAATTENWSCWGNLVPGNLFVSITQTTLCCGVETFDVFGYRKPPAVVAGPQGTDASAEDMMSRGQRDQQYHYIFA